MSRVSKKDLMDLRKLAVLDLFGVLNWLGLCEEPGQGAKAWQAIRWKALVDDDELDKEIPADIVADIHAMWESKR